MESNSGSDSASSVRLNTNSKRKTETADTSSSIPNKKLKFNDGSQSSSINLPFASTFEPAHPHGSTAGIARSILHTEPGAGSSSSRNNCSHPTGLTIKQLGGVAATVLGMPTSSSGSQATRSQKQMKEEFMDLPHSVLQMTAAGLQCDLIVAGLLQSQGLLETVLCVPRDLINVSLRLSKGLLTKNTCEVRHAS